MVNGLVLHGGAEPVWTQWIVIWCCKWTTVDTNTVWSSVWSSSCKCIEVGWGQHGGLSTKVQSCWNILWTAALIVTSSLVDLMSDPLSTLQCLSYVPSSPAVDSPAKCQICQWSPLYSEQQRRRQVAATVQCLTQTRTSPTFDFS